MKMTKMDLRKVIVRPLSTPEEIRQWNDVVKSQHYLKSSTMVGEQIRYVAEYMGQWVACMGCSAATLKSVHRSKWVGWSRIQEEQRRHLIIQNARFLILENIAVPNLASRCLSLLGKRVSSDWKVNYGHPIYLMETFVDQDRPGTCYKACGWEELGLTRGFRRAVGAYRRHGLKKSYWVYPLRKNAQKLLGGSKTPDDKPLSSLKINILPLKEKGETPSIQNILKEYFPRTKPKKNTGKPYPKDVIVGLVLSGLVCGVKDCENIASWAKNLDKKFKEILNCPYREFKGEYGYQTPSANTIRYALQDIDSSLLVKAMTAWANLCGINTEKTILALDGKVICGAKTDDERAPNHVTLYDVDSGTVLDQELVPNKTSEVTVAREIFERNNLDQSLVTADAAHTTSATANAILKKKVTTCSPSKTINLNFSTPWKRSFFPDEQEKLTSVITVDTAEMRNGPLKRSLLIPRIK